MSWMGGNKDVASRRSGIVTVLDVGSSKVCCVIARLRPRGESPILRARTHEVQVIGIGLVRKCSGASGQCDAAKAAVVIWFFFALPFATYADIYSVAHDSTLLLIDAGHLLLGWVVSAAVLALIK